MFANIAIGFVFRRSRATGHGEYGRSVAMMICVLACTATVTSGRGIEFRSREAKMWEYEEWTRENASWSGNPFDVVAEVAFAHSPTDMRRKTQMFYAGSNQ